MPASTQSLQLAVAQRQEEIEEAAAHSAPVGVLSPARRLNCSASGDTASSAPAISPARSPHKQPADAVDEPDRDHAADHRQHPVADHVVAEEAQHPGDDIEIEVGHPPPAIAEHIGAGCPSVMARASMPRSPSSPKMPGIVSRLVRRRASASARMPPTSTVSQRSRQPGQARGKEIALGAGQQPAAARPARRPGEGQDQHQQRRRPTASRRAGSVISAAQDQRGRARQRPASRPGPAR